MQRYQGPFDRPDREHEEKLQQQKLEAHPEEVSTTSSVHQVFHEQGVEDQERDEDMLAGVKADFVCSSRQASGTC